MFFKNIYVLVLWTKAVSALEELIGTYPYSSESTFEGKTLVRTGLTFLLQIFLQYICFIQKLFSKYFRLLIQLKGTTIIMNRLTLSYLYRA